MNTLSITQSIKYITAVVLILTTVACGGGGGSDASSTKSTNTTNTATNEVKTSVETENTAPQVDTAKQAKNFSDLAVAQTFEFTNSNTLTLDIEIASLTDTPAYVSVCQVVNNTSKYTDCIYRGKMTKGSINANIELPNHVESLAMAIWYLDGSNQREHYNWQRADGMNWQVR